jgi:hypothetical protein
MISYNDVLLFAKSFMVASDRFFWYLDPRLTDVFFHQHNFPPEHLFVHGCVHHSRKLLYRF